MPSSAKCLLIGSTEAYSGKSVAILGIGMKLQSMGIEIAYGKPIGNLPTGSEAAADPDLAFIAETLGLGPSHLYEPLVSLDPSSIEPLLRHCDSTALPLQLQRYGERDDEQLLLLEGPRNLTEGALLGLSLPQMAMLLDAPVILVTRFDSLLLIDRLLVAKQQLGTRLLGVIINDVPEAELARVDALIKPCLKQQAIPLLAMLPQDPIMRSISVREIVKRLHADVLCCADRLNLMVESLTIGAMSVNSALRYFRKGINMAVVTGGDRADIQLAALETSTQCLVLTGHIPPSAEIVARATDLEVPILSVDSDTLTTVEQIDQMFGQVRLHEPGKVPCIREMTANHLDIQYLIDNLGLKLPATTPQT